MNQRSSKPELTIGIPTGNRPERLAACLHSLREHVDIPYDLTIVDSSTQESSAVVLSEYAEARIIKPPSQVSPAEARLMIARECATPLLLYLDDDMTVSAGAVQKLYRYLERSPQTHIVGGAVSEYGHWRDIGFAMAFAETGGARVVIKQRIRKLWLDRNKIEALQVDIITQPPFLVRHEVFEKVNFDPNYLWALEIYDFFLQCRQAGLTSAVIPDAIFHHWPIGYAAPTHKDDKRAHNAAAAKFFEHKWGLRVLNLPQGTPLKDLIADWIDRRKRSKMVRRKIASESRSARPRATRDAQ